jgi:hypothetical protein
MEVYAGIYMGVDGWIRGLAVWNAVGDAEALGIEPGELPQLLSRAPDGAEALGAFAKIGFVIGDADGDDFVVAPARVRARGCQGMDSTISSTVLRRRPDAWS